MEKHFTVLYTKLFTVLYIKHFTVLYIKHFTVLYITADVTRITTVINAVTLKLCILFHQNVFHDILTINCHYLKKKKHL
jgi:hypothetical protein